MKDYFNTKEISCPCCNLRRFTTEAEYHLAVLNIARAIARIPFHINSWTRCEKHNNKIGGAPSSSHLKGIASDIGYTNSTELFTIINALQLCGFKRILVYPKSLFIHVDSDSTKIQPILKVMEQEC